MADVVSAEKRSQMMAAIKGKNTKPELLVRRALHRRGFRFRLHVRDLPGRPDIVLPRYKAAIFVNGCFWHGHTCKYFKLPATNTEFWREKISANQERDALKTKQLIGLGFRVLSIWECQTRAGPESFDALIDILANDLRQDELKD
jgi:DNA mismatch endonuclease, patch repair protein